MDSPIKPVFQGGRNIPEREKSFAHFFSPIPLWFHELTSHFDRPQRKVLWVVLRVRSNHWMATLSLVLGAVAASVKERPLSLGGKDYKGMHRPRQAHVMFREQAQLNHQLLHHKGQAYRSHQLVDTTPRAFHTLIQILARGTSLSGCPAKRYCSEQNDHCTHRGSGSSYVPGTGLGTPCILIIPSSWWPC